MNTSFITDIKEARDLLLSKQVICDRLSGLANNSHHDDAIVEVFKFFSHWPMFMDGDIHKQNRSLVVAAIKKREALDTSEFQKIITLKFVGVKYLGELEIHSIADEWHRWYFGIDRVLQKEIEIFSVVLDKFFSAPRGEDWDPIPILKQLKKIRNAFDSAEFISDSFVQLCKQLCIHQDTCISLVVDSLFPIRSSLSSIIHFRLMHDESTLLVLPPREALSLALSELPPFRYISRCFLSRNDNINDSRKVSIDIFQCHKNERESSATGRKDSFLTFGMGSHHCPGYNPTFNMLTEVWIIMRDVWRSNHIDYTFNDIKLDEGKCVVIGQHLNFR